jgi:adenosylmethionine-8-amino-7-oxononanoate aminotransferase
MSHDLARHLMVDFTQMKNFAEDPLVLEHGEGIRVTDDRGRTSSMACPVYSPVISVTAILRLLTP